MNRMAGLLVAMAVAVSVLGDASCATSGPSAAELLQNRKLVNRAAYDLDCTEPLGVTAIDAKTRGVRGCGRQATYVLICDAPVDQPLRSCVWVNDSYRAALQ
jgi:hypothetical protein